MSIISRRLINQRLVESGFTKIIGKQNLFLTSNPSEVTPAFLCNVFRRNGKVSVGGAVGLYFTEFEELWEKSISKEERRIDATLPLVMLIENYRELDHAGVLRYLESSQLRVVMSHIHELISHLPNSIVDFEKSLIGNTLLGINISTYLHIFDYHSDDNLYFRKSICFVRWFMNNYPHLAEHLSKCLTTNQKERLGLR